MQWTKGRVGSLPQIANKTKTYIPAHAFKLYFMSKSRYAIDMRCSPVKNRARPLFENFQLRWLAGSCVGQQKRDSLTEITLISLS